MTTFIFDPIDLFSLFAVNGCLMFSNKKINKSQLAYIVLFKK